MIKAALTPKNILYWGFIAAGLVVSAFLFYLSFNSDFFQKREITEEPTSPEKQYETVNAPGVELYSVYGLIKELDEEAKTFTISSLLDSKEYRVQLKDQPITYKIKNQPATIEDLHVGLEIGVFSKEEFDDSAVIDDFSYIVITEKAPVVGEEPDSGDFPSAGGEE